MQHRFALFGKSLAISGVRDDNRNHRSQKSLRFRCAKHLVFEFRAPFAAFLNKFLVFLLTRGRSFRFAAILDQAKHGVIDTGTTLSTRQQTLIWCALCVRAGECIVHVCACACVCVCVMLWFFPLNDSEVHMTNWKETGDRKDHWNHSETKPPLSSPRAFCDRVGLAWHDGVLLASSLLLVAPIGSMCCTHCSPPSLPMLWTRMSLDWTLKSRRPKSWWQWQRRQCCAPAGLVRTTKTLNPESTKNSEKKRSFWGHFCHFFNNFFSEFQGPTWRGDFVCFS